jgi:hypothetical protein
MGLSCELVQGLDRLEKEFALFLATIDFPDESTRAVEQEYGPPR